jgi:hypothetical protein
VIRFSAICSPPSALRGPSWPSQHLSYGCRFPRRGCATCHRESGAVHQARAVTRVTQQT